MNSNSRQWKVWQDCHRWKRQIRPTGKYGLRHPCTPRHRRVADAVLREIREVVANLPRDCLSQGKEKSLKAFRFYLFFFTSISTGDKKLATG